MIETTLGKISAVLKTGKTPPSKNEAYFENDFNWYTPGDITNTKFISTSERHISNLAIEDRKAFLYPEKSILITCIGNIGRVGISNEKCASNQQITAIKPIDKVDVDYLYYWFLLNQRLLKAKSNSAVVPILNNRTLKEVPFKYPPLKTQQHIASILNDAAALRDKTAQLLKEYDLLAQSIFLEMFGDPVVNPKGLELIKLGDLGKWQSGGTPSRKNTKYYSGKIPWLSSGELNEMYISDSKEHITEKALEESSTKLVPKRSLLLGMYDTAALKSTINIKEVTCNQAIAFGVLNSELIDIVYAYYIIQIGRKHYRRLQRGARQKNLNLSMVKGIKILYPSLERQNQFAEKIALIEQQKALAKQDLQESEDLFNCLLQKAFKGELV